jgi:hypothetical protein
MYSLFWCSYQQELKTLNQSVLRWIEQHVRSDPTCILSPVFTDYNRYVEELDKKYPADMDALKPSVMTEGGTKSSDGDGEFLTFSLWVHNSSL